MSETTTMEMVQRVGDDAEVRRATDALAVLHAQREVQLKHREDLRLIVVHTRDQHVPVPTALATMDVRDAGRELVAVDRAIEDLGRALKSAELRLDQAESAASERILNAARPQYLTLVATVEQARRSLAAAEAARMAFLRDLERRGARTGGLTAEG